MVQTGSGVIGLSLMDLLAFAFALLLKHVLS